MKQVRQKIKPYIQMPFKVFYKNKIGCKDMYNIFLREKEKEISSLVKWRDKGYEMNEFDWRSILNSHLKLHLNLTSNGYKIK